MTYKIKSTTHPENWLTILCFTYSVIAFDNRRTHSNFAKAGILILRFWSTHFSEAPVDWKLSAPSRPWFRPRAQTPPGFERTFLTVSNFRTSDFSNQFLSPLEVQKNGIPLYLSTLLTVVFNFYYIHHPSPHHDLFCDILSPFFLQFHCHSLHFLHSAFFTLPLSPSALLILRFPPNQILSPSRKPHTL